MPRNITELRESIRNEQAALDAQRLRNQALMADSNATAEQYDAASAETNRINARIRMMQDELNTEEARQRDSLPTGGNTGSVYTNRRSELLRSNEHARAFANAISNGLNRKNGRGREDTKILFDALTEGGGDPVGTDGGFLVPEVLNDQATDQVRALAPPAPFSG